MPRERKFSTPQRAPFHEPMGEETLIAVEQHWRALRKGMQLPQNVDMTSGHLAGELGHCFMLERVTPTVARFRVAGQAIHKLLNMEPRGMPISALFTPVGREMLASVVFDVCENVEIMEIPLIAQRGLGRTPLRGRLLLLPLKSDDTVVTRIFGAMVVDNKPSRRGIRFDFDKDAMLRRETATSVIRTVHEVEPTDADFELTKVLSENVTRTPLRLVVDNT